MTSELPEQTNEELILCFLADGGEDYTSGEALSDKLGLSRTAVWKHVEALRGKGYRIEAIAARGYRLLEVPDRLSTLELSPLLSTRELGRVLDYHDSLSSTNERAYALAQDDAPHGQIVIAEQQTAGRGRRGRSWSSPSGVNLYVSAVLRPDLPPHRAPELTLVAAVAVAQTLRDAKVEASIKWPNDVLVGGRKIAGILTELSADSDRVHFVILGIGVNLNARRSDFPAELATTATSLREIRGERVPRALFAAALLARLEEWLDVHADGRFDEIRQTWKGLSSTLGQEVLVRTEGTEFQGIAEDLDETGALWVRMPDGGRRKVIAGDVDQLRSRAR